MIVYVAGPYRAPTSAERDANIERAEAAALQLWLQGHVAVCPHAMTRSYQDPALDATFRAGTIKMRALAKLGELLQQIEKASGGQKGGRKRIDGTRVEPSNTPPTYADLGISKMRRAALSVVPSGYQ